MTIPYNATKRSMKDYLVETLEQIELDVNSDSGDDGMLRNKKANLFAYGNSNNKNNVVYDSDIVILINIIYKIIMNDYERIKRLCMYLKNVATLFNKLDLPIA